MNNKRALRNQLDRSSVPLYLQIATLIRRRINSGEWIEGFQLPTLEELMEEFGVGRVTVRQALDIMEREGLVRRQRGRGTFVSQSGADRHWLTLVSNWSTLMQATEGTVTETLVDEVATDPPPLAEDEGDLASAYRYMRRVHRLDGRPYAVLDIFLDKEIYDRAEPGIFDRTTVLRAMGNMADVEIGNAWQTVTIDTADAATAALLDVPVNDPVAEVRRVALDPARRVIYFCHLVYRGDFVRFRIDLKD
jgi:GntR family transcriptional regulator